MTGHTREKLLTVHGQLVDSEDNLIADGGIGIGDFGTSSAFHTDGGKEPSVVVKIGGAKAVDPKGTASDVAHLAANGTDVVVAHGGSTTVDETLGELGEEPTYVELPSGVSDRFINGHAMEAFSMMVPNKLSIDLATLLHEADVGMLDLSGVDGGLLTGPRESAVCVVEGGKRKIKCGDHSGEITSVDATLLRTLLDSDYTPIVTVPMLADDDVPINTDTDHAAAAVAGAFGTKFVVLTDVKGVYAGPDNESTLIETADTSREFSALESATEGFVTKKAMATKEALGGGTAKVVVADANLNNPIVMALNDDGIYVTPGALVEAEGAEQ